MKVSTIFLGSPVNQLLSLSASHNKKTFSALFRWNSMDLGSSVPEMGMKINYIFLTINHNMTHVFYLQVMEWESWIFFFFFVHFSWHAGSSPDQGLNVRLLQWKCTVLTTRSPRKSFWISFSHWGCLYCHQEPLGRPQPWKCPLYSNLHGLLLDESEPNMQESIMQYTRYDLSVEKRTKG